MTKQKTRPDNNFHCFEGLGLPFWRAIASGHTPSRLDPVQGPDGARWQFKLDIDGFTLKNGGMLSPQETKLAPGYYFRFFGTINHNLYGVAGGMSGGWWIDYENLKKITKFANDTGYSLAKSAQLLLIIPNEWQDCGYLGCAKLHNQMKAFVGRGAPATGSLSPANKLRQVQQIPVTGGVSYLDMKQYFVPGFRDEIGRAFAKVWVKQVIRPGIQIF
jgi:hypothetical protein